MTHDYDGPAEERTVTAWFCAKCGRYHGGGESGERMARCCCAQHSRCRTCGGVAKKCITRCDACSNAEDDRKFAALPRVEWDGEFPIANRGEKFFFDDESVNEYAHEIAENGGTLEDLKFVVCVPNKPRVFEAPEFWSDDIHENDVCPPAGELEAIVGEWAEANLPTMWWSGNQVLSEDSVRGLIDGETLERLDANAVEDTEVGDVKTEVE